VSNPIKDLAVALAQAMKDSQEAAAARKQKEMLARQAAEQEKNKDREEALDTLFGDAKTSLVDAYDVIKEFFAPPYHVLRVYDARDAIKNREHNRRQLTAGNDPFSYEIHALPDGRIVEHFVSLIVPVHVDGRDWKWSAAFAREIMNQKEKERAKSAGLARPTEYGDEIIVYVEKGESRAAGLVSEDPFIAIKNPDWAGDRVQDMLSLLTQGIAKGA
jgi:hypothetical protein